MNKNILRKKLNYNDIIKKYSKFYVPLPDRKATDIMNHPMISNLLSDDYLTDEIKYQIQTLDKSTQTPYERGTQTDSLDKATQKDFKPEHHDLYPHLYYKIDAFSKYMPNNKDLKNKNDATSETVKTENNELNDNINQSSKYIPGSLKKKSDNINQTVRYMLKTFESPIPTPDPTPIPSANPTPTPTEEDLPDIYNKPKGLIGWLFGPREDMPVDPPSPPSSKPSVPSASSLGIRSPSESPSASSAPSIPPYPPFSPSPVAYPASEEETESRSRKSGSNKSGKNKK
jgi:hypothetical protein